MLKKYSTETIVDHDLEALADLMAENHEFAAKLADAIAKKLDEKFGFRQGEMNAGFEALSKKVDTVSSKIDTVSENIDRQFDPLNHNFEMLGQRHTLFEGDLRKVNDRLDDIAGHLGISTDKRRRA